MNLKKGSFFAVLLLLPVFVMNCGPHPHCRKDGEERILRRIDKKVQSLNLDSAQEAKYKEVRSKVFAELKANMDNRRATMNILEEELKKTEPDLQKAVRSMQENYRKKPADMSVFGDHFLEFYSVLNPEQKKLVQEELRKTMRRFSCNRD